MYVIKKNKHWVGKEQIIFYFAFVIEVIIIIFCYFLKANSWTDTKFMTVNAAMLYSGSIILILLIISLFITIFFKQFAVEKKLLTMLGAITISLGVLGLADLTFESEITFFDIIYKSIQFFVGEFEYPSIQNKQIPPMVNIGRFLGLFVTFGAIFTIILKQKIYYMNVKLFYRDILIITDEPEGYILDLANKFVQDNRKVIVAHTAHNESQSQITNGEIQVISIDIKKNMKSSLQICNIKNVKKIFLLCTKTQDNIKLLKAIYKNITNDDNNKNIVDIKNEINEKPKTTDELIDEYNNLIFDKDHNETEVIRKRKTKNTVCYIQYQTDQERQYYSIDSIFTNKTDNFITYFINIYDISIRQMIAKSTVVNSLNTKNISTNDLINELKSINIAIAGSGEMLNRTLIEITKNCIYNDKVPLKIFYLEQKQTYDEKQEIKLPIQLEGLVDVEIIAIKDAHKIPHKINLFFVSSVDEKEIRAILHEIFQNDLQNIIHNYLILTEGNVVEYDILKTYINGLLSPYKNGQRKFEDQNFEPVIQISNIKDLIPSIDKFYHVYGPTS